MTWDNLKPPVAPVDGWGKPAPVHDEVDLSTPQPASNWGKVAEIAGNVPSWGVHPNQTSPMTVSYEEWAAETPITSATEHELREALWVTNALDSADVRASVVNSLGGTKDNFTVDQDGELTRMTPSTQRGPHGYYIAYHNGKWLHAILSGPYASADAARLQFDKCYAMFVEDTAFQIAFDRNFNKAGIYCAEIPLSANRKGAYGVLW